MLGSGLYSDSAINLLKGIDSLGIVLTVLYTFLFTFMRWGGKGKVAGFKISIALLPLFITSLLAQPIVDAPLVYIVIFITRQTLSYSVSNISIRGAH